MTKNQTHIFQGKVAEKANTVVGGVGARIAIEAADTGERWECIDAVTGAAVGALGWADPEVPKYYAEALCNSTYSFTPVVGNNNAEALAQFLIDNSPAGAFDAALFVGSGSEANDNAMKIIRQYYVEKGQPRKTKYIGREVSYHGFTIGAMSLSSGFRLDAFQEICLPRDRFPTLQVCHPYRDQGDLTTEQYVAQLLANAEQTILAADPETVASITLETMPGSALGTVPPPPGYLPGIRRLCDKYDILLHLDEVMCGTGRCNDGGLHCWENFMEPGTGPDIQTIGKTLGLGYVTIAGVLMAPKIKRAYCAGSGLVLGGQTYAGHALNCHVALRIQQRIKALNLTANVFRMGTLLGKRMAARLAECPLAGSVRGFGGFWTVEFVKNRATKESFPKALDVAHRFADLAYVNGLSVMALQGSNRGAGDHALFAPAFVITEPEVEQIVVRTEKTLTQLAAQLRAEGHMD